MKGLEFVARWFHRASAVDVLVTEDEEVRGPEHLPQSSGDVTHIGGVFMKAQAVHAGVGDRDQVAVAGSQCRYRTDGQVVLGAAFFAAEAVRLGLPAISRPVAAGREGHATPHKQGGTLAGGFRPVGHMGSVWRRGALFWPPMHSGKTVAAMRPWVALSARCIFAAVLLQRP